MKIIKTQKINLFIHSVSHLKLDIYNKKKYSHSNFKYGTYCSLFVLYCLQTRHFLLLYLLSLLR